MLHKVFTREAPEPIGPYSQAIRTGDLLFISGQIAIDPDSGHLIKGSIEEETELVLGYLKSILHAEGLSLKFVVKCSVFVRNIDDFGKINQIYAAFFDHHAPARELVEVSRLPKDANIEISLIASYK